MACPFLKEDYVGFCSASAFPYVPSIVELEQKCFKDSCETCINCNSLQATEQVKAD